MVNHGHYFILPEIVYRKFEEVAGKPKQTTSPAMGVMTVHSCQLEVCVSAGQIRPLRQARTVHFPAKELAKAFVAGVNLPSGNELGRGVKNMLGGTSFCFRAGQTTGFYQNKDLQSHAGFGSFYALLINLCL